MSTQIWVPIKLFVSAVPWLVNLTLELSMLSGLGNQTFPDDCKPHWQEWGEADVWRIGLMVMQALRWVSLGSGILVLRLRTHSKNPKRS
jgi:hypothetical protein